MVTSDGRQVRESRGACVTAHAPDEPWPLDEDQRWEPPLAWFEQDAPDPVGRGGDALAPAMVDAEPGVPLAAALVAVELERLDDYDLVEAVAAWDRVVSWAQGQQLDAVAVLAARESMNPPWPPTAGRVARPNVAGDELALRLGRTRRAANAMVDLARALGGPLAPTAGLLDRGRLDLAQVRAIHDGLASVPDAGCADVQDLVLDRAPERTPGQLAKDVSRALIALDPVGASARVEQACRGRRVDRPRPLAHGMAGVWAVLPADRAMTIDAGLDSRARTLRAAGTGGRSTSCVRTSSWLRCSSRSRGTAGPAFAPMAVISEVTPAAPPTMPSARCRGVGRATVATGSRAAPRCTSRCP